MTASEKIAIRKKECEYDGLYFNRFFFKQRFGFKMLINWHHKLIQDTLDKVISLDIKRLIINLPPGYTKTELSTINFIARGLALNPMSRFMHLSYSNSLALENSSTARKIIQSEAYQQMWPLKLRDDADSKQKWWTEQGGGVYATSAGGQVTGFRAGHMEDGFTGALIIDDPVKPDDADYEERKRVNNRFNETIKSRLAKEDIPIVVIMQRIHRNDLSGYLLKGGSGETWDHLSLPVLNTKEKYNDDYTHGKEIEYDASYDWLWADKHNEKNKIELQSHKRTYWCQYMQMPEKYIIDGALFSQDIIDRYRIDRVPQGKTLYIVQALDPSGDDGSDETKADEIGDVTCAIDEDLHYYLLFDDSGNGSPKEWADRAVKRYNLSKVNILVYERNYGGAMVENTIRNVVGGDLVLMSDVVASKGKLIRAEPVSALYEQGRVHHVGKFYDLEDEMTTYDGKGKSPNRLDALVWAITYLYEYGEMPNMSDSMPTMGGRG
jgi:hypothetical protein